MSKSIIIEGLDRSGKDTQQKLIMKNFPEMVFQTLHYSTLPFKDPIKYKDYSTKLYHDMFKMMMQLNKCDVNLILNRSHLGEYVYSPIYRGYDGDYIFKIEQEYIHYLKNDLYLITLLNDPDILFSRDDGQSHSKSVEDIEKESSLFRKAHNLSNIKNKLLINIGSMNAEEVSYVIRDFLNEKKENNNMDLEDLFYEAEELNLRNELMIEMKRLEQINPFKYKDYKLLVQTALDNVKKIKNEDL